MRRSGPEQSLIVAVLGLARGGGGAQMRFSWDFGGDWGGSVLKFAAQIKL